MDATFSATESPDRYSLDIDIPLAPWSGLSKVTLMFLSVYLKWITNVSDVAPASSLPVHEPSKSVVSERICVCPANTAKDSSVVRRYFFICVSSCLLFLVIGHKDRDYLAFVETSPPFSLLSQKYVVTLHEIWKVWTCNSSLVNPTGIYNIR